jgi:hypothetical protein
MNPIVICSIFVNDEFKGTVDNPNDLTSILRRTLKVTLDKFLSSPFPQKERLRLYFSAINDSFGYYPVQQFTEISFNKEEDIKTNFDFCIKQVKDACDAITDNYSEY